MSDSSFLSLPNELIHTIIILLHPSSIVICKRLCRSIRDIIDDSLEITLILEVFLDGRLLHESRCRQNPSELLRDFRQMKQRFDSFLPVTSWTLGDYHHQYNVLRDGYFGQIDWLEDSQRRYIQLQLTAVAPLNDKIRTITRDFYEVSTIVIGISFNFNEDLLVVVSGLRHDDTGTLFLFSIATGRPHPSAKIPELEFYSHSPPDRFLARQRCDIHICEDILLVNLLCNEDEDEGCLLFWNWKSGQARTPVYPLTDYCLLNKDTLVVLMNGVPPSFHIFSLVDSSIHQILRLPFSKRISNGGMYAREPTAESKPRALYMSDTAVEVIGIYAGTDSIVEEANFVVFFSRSRLLKLVQDAENPRQEFEWPAWGPPLSRWIPCGSIYFGRYCLSGSRFICRSTSVDPFHHFPPDSHAFMVGYLTILDFNPRPIAFDASNRETDYSSIRIISDPWTLEGPFFTCPVESHLPFRVISRKEGEMFFDLYSPWLDDYTMIKAQANSGSLPSYRTLSFTSIESEPVDSNPLEEAE